MSKIKNIVSTIVTLKMASNIIKETYVKPINTKVLIKNRMEVEIFFSYRKAKINPLIIDGTIKKIVSERSIRQQIATVAIR